jgi:hypothetical protein
MNSWAETLGHRLGALINRLRPRRDPAATKAAPTPSAPRKESFLPVWQPPPAPKPDTRAAEQFLALLLSDRATAGMSVPGMNLSGTWLRALPERLQVQGDLILQQCPRLQRIGRGLQVHGRLVIGGSVCTKPSCSRWGSPRLHDPPLELPNPALDRQCYLRELPALTAQVLHISHSNALESLPSGLQVRILSLSACDALRSLPDGLQLEELHITGCRNLRTLPGELQVDRLVLINTAIEELPDTFGASEIKIVGCRRLRLLPATLRCNVLRLGHLSSLESLPGIESKWRASILSLPRLRRVDGVLKGEMASFSGHSALVSFRPAKLAVDSLYVTHCPMLTELPGEMKLSYLNLRSCPSLTRLPSPLRLGRLPRRTGPGSENCLDLSGCHRIEQWPQEFHFQSPVRLDGSGLEQKEPADTNFMVRHRGVALPAHTYYHPETIQPAEALREQNAELRRVLLELAGLEKVLAGEQAEVVDEDLDAGGLRQLLRLPAAAGKEEPFCYLRCQCPSTARVYLLRVPQGMISCRQAAAWVAGFKNPDDYQPVLET